MRAFVTGATGFVGPHLIAALESEGWESEAAHANVCDAEALRVELERAQPDVVFHLAAQSFVPESMMVPRPTYDVNILGAVHLSIALRSLRLFSGRVPRLLFTSSAEVYGARDPSEMPLLETLAPKPANPYAASKVAAEAILLAEMRAYGGDVVVARAFNHIGPGQSDRFAVAGFARGLAEIAAGDRTTLEVGNLDAERDVLDVRDVVRAYVALAERGEPGETYNVCRGSAVSMRELLRELIATARVPVEVRTDPTRLRRSETPISFGSNAKLVERTGWSPRIALTDSLRDIYEDARKRLAS